MNRIFLFSLFLGMISCDTKSGVEVPTNVLPPAKITDVLLDIHILEASMGLNMISRNDSTTSDTILFYDIFENHQISKKQYDESMDFYMKNPKILNQIYDSVLIKIEEKKEINQKT